MLGQHIINIKRNHDNYLSSVENFKKYLDKWIFKYNDIEVVVVDFIEDGWIVVIESLDSKSELSDLGTTNYLYLDEIEDLKIHKQKENENHDCKSKL